MHIDDAATAAALECPPGSNNIVDGNPSPQHAGRVVQNSRYLAVGPDERDRYAPGRNEAATAIADAPQLNARCTPSATPALCTSTTTSSRGGFSAEPGNETPIVSLICMSDLLAYDRSTERRLRPHTRAAEDGSKIEFMTVERKITSRHEVAARNRWKTGWWK
jgi:hypothetical protein